jgi:hypothetical protein
MGSGVTRVDILVAEEKRVDGFFAVPGDIR